MRPATPARALCAAAGALLGLAVLLPAALPPAAAHGGTDSFTATGAVYDVTWNSAGTMFAAATDRGNISLYDGLTHAKIREWHAQDGPINEVAFSPDLSRIASASGAYRCATKEQSLKVFTLLGEQLLNITDHYDWVTSVQWSPRGDLIASSSGVDSHIDTDKIYGEVKFWNSSTGSPVWNATPPNASYAARISWAPDSHALAAVGHLNDIWLFYPYGATRTFELINHSYHDPVGHASHGWAISWSPDSKYIVGGFSYDWTRPSSQTGEFNPDGGTDVGPVIVFDPDRRDGDGFAAQLLRGDLHSKPVGWVSWDPTGTFIASCSGVDLVDTRGPSPIAGQDGLVDAGELVVWNFSASGAGRLLPVNVWIFGLSWCSSNAFRPGQNVALTAGNADGTIKLYVFDEDGDGWNVWADDAPLDPLVHKIVPEHVPDFWERWGIPVLLVGAAAIAVIVWAAIARSTVEVEPGGKRQRDRDRPRGRSTGRNRSSRRR